MKVRSHLVLFISILMLSLFNQGEVLAQFELPIQFRASDDARSSALGFNKITIPSIANAITANPGLLSSGYGQMRLQYDSWTQCFAFDAFTEQCIDFDQYMAAFKIDRVGNFGWGYSSEKSSIEGSYYSSRNTRSSHFLSFGSTILNTIGLGISTNYVEQKWSNSSVFEENSNDWWYYTMGLSAKTPLFRFRTDYLDDELRVGITFRDTFGENKNHILRYGFAYEISPVIFLPSLDSHIHPFNFMFSYEIEDYNDFDKNNKGWGLEIGLGEIFFYRFGHFDAFFYNSFDSDHVANDDSRGFGIRLPIDILTNDEWPIQIQYDRADPPFDNDVIHSFRLNLLFEGKLTLPF